MECIIHKVDFRKNHLEKVYFVWINVIHLIIFGSQEWDKFLWTEHRNGISFVKNEKVINAYLIKYELDYKP